MFPRHFKLVAAGLATFLAITLVAQSVEARDQNNRYRKHKSGVFDYYTLVLTWSPTYCDSRQGQRDRAQCGRRRHYDFVVHGLWPQYNKGWPERCFVPKRNLWLTSSVIDGMLDIMPSKRLIIHEWKKHGTCSGLSGKDYFGVTRQLFDKIKIPARYIDTKSYITTTPQQLEKDFTSTNRWLKPSMVAVKCGRKRRLKELRFCFNKDLQPMACGANERGDCRTRQLVLPPVR